MFGLPYLLPDDNFLLATLFVQICVFHSVHHGPVTAEYSISGTTYSPEGVVLDSAGIQVINDLQLYAYVFILNIKFFFTGFVQ